MAALQGANVPGADTRCLDNGTSSLSAFLRVARPDDDPDSLYLDLNVPSLPAMQEPLDSLQTLYDAWKATLAAPEPGVVDVRLFPNPGDGRLTVVLGGAAHATAECFAAGGQRVMTVEKLEPGTNTLLLSVPSGVYFMKFSAGHHGIVWRRIVVRN
jgi:hypothetical protein